MGTILSASSVSVTKAVDVAKLLAVVWIALLLALGACSTERDQGVTTTGTPDQGETSIDDTSDAEGESELDGTTLDPSDPVPNHGDTTGATTTTEPITSTDRDAAVTPPDDANPLPEPGDGLVHPKAPNTTKVVPPPRD